MMTQPLSQAEVLAASAQHEEEVAQAARALLSGVPESQQQQLRRSSKPLTPPGSPK